eukprot:2532919-Prymnesium_polylepis.1
MGADSLEAYAAKYRLRVTVLDRFGEPHPLHAPAEAASQWAYTEADVGQSVEVANGTVGLAE